MRTLDPPPSYPNFLALLHSEERHLTDALASLTELHSALSCGDLAKLATQEPRQIAIAEALQTARVAQETIAAQLAEELGLADRPARLVAIADCLPPLAAAEVRSVRERLVALTDRLAELHRQNANLVHQLRSYLRTVFALLTESATPARYGPRGATVTAGSANAVRISG